ncbi:hypothetical protein NFI96_028341 [Prochilodus magdalenae]|nr:hypothetical protein NFI96_028341 [Prochilodus magdalenae]
MERSGAVLLTLVCVWFSRTSGAEVERRVRPGNDVTLHCDCVVRQRSELAWFRNCSDGSHPPLLLTSSSESFPRYGFVRNSSSKSYDLFVKNVMEKDLGLYYCARREKDLHRNTTCYHYGNLTTRILLRDRNVNCLQAGGGDVCYAALDLPSRGQKPLKKKKKRRVESSEFSTYSEVKFNQV